MNHQITEPKIREFFQWLEKKLSKLTNSKELQLEVTKKLKSLHPDLHWEAGPTSQGDKFFAFSPNLNEGLLAVTNILVKNAPKITGWRFFAAKPKKNWQNRRIKFSSKGDVKKVDCNNWQYFLTSFNDDEFFDVNIVPNTQLDLTQKELNYVAGLFVEFELGEELYIQAVDSVNVLEIGSNLGDTNNVDVLHEHILEQWKRTH